MWKHILEFKTGKTGLLHAIIEEITIPILKGDGFMTISLRAKTGISRKGLKLRLLAGLPFSDPQIWSGA
jgi:hypothetical protein